MAYLDLIDCGAGGPRCDVTPLFLNYTAFASLVADLAGHFDVAPDCVAGIDALGFILGTALALHWRVGFAAIRKAGKLPGAADQESFVDYTGQPKGLELRAAAALVERQGGVVVGIAAIHIDLNDATRRLMAQYNCQALEYEE